MDGYKCIGCNKFVVKGSYVYIVKGEHDVLFPACSLECTDKFKQETIKVLKNKIDTIENQVIERDIW